MREPKPALGSTASLVEFPTEIVAHIERLTSSPNGKGWLRLIEHLEAAAADPEVRSSPGASETVDLFIELAKDSLSATDAIQALAPIDGLLPKGAFGEQFKKNSGRGESKLKKLVRKVLPALKKRLKRKPTAREVWAACEARKGTNIQFVNSPVWGTPDRAIPENEAPAKWSRFQVIVSEVRRELKT